MGLTVSSAFPSRYFKSSDLNGRETLLHISHVKLEVVGQEQEQKPVVYFSGHQKGLVLNKTNARTLAQAYGDDTDPWIGRPVILREMMVDYRGTPTNAIRVIIPPPPRRATVIGHDPGNPPLPNAIPDGPQDPEDEIPF